MNKEQYLNQLMQQSNYCKCPSLVELFEKRKAARDLEARCDFLKGNVDLEHPKPEDRPILEDYKGNASDLKKVSEYYHKELYQHALDSKVYFKLHESEKDNNSRIISFEEAEPIFDKMNKILSVHCYYCNQQIDVVGYRQE